MKVGKTNSARLYPIHKQIILLVVAISINAYTVSAQQEWLYSQAQFNIYDLNGAYAGSYDEASLALRIRQQWVGFEGAPKSQYLSVHLPIVQNLGFGARLLNENIGARTRQKLTSSLSVKIPLKNGFVGFGINTGVLRQQFVEDRINIRDPQDATLINYTDPEVLLLFDFSALWYSKKYYLGLEIQNLNEPSFKSQSIIDLQQKKHVVFIGAYVFELNDNFAIKPTTRIFYNKNSKLLTDVNMNFLFFKKIWLGAGMRLGLGMDFFAEWNISDKLRIGYSFDIYRREGLAGSHEVFLGYNLSRRGSANSIRYFR